MEEQLTRIADAFERIAHALESVNKGLEVTLSGDISTSIDRSSIILEGPLVIQHEFMHDVPLGLLYVEPNERAFKVELSNCTDTETPFAVQVND